MPSTGKSNNEHILDILDELLRTTWDDEYKEPDAPLQPPNRSYDIIEDNLSRQIADDWKRGR